ncbi:hypothetical protein E2562_038752 [Oryza meyeriana var. granulata]|uniref:Uncharacterized protein n=1 Tax=Oryza meyeriana var. granulata TaxID=110450 RepID=A0A6G1BQ74_9ORYZ|nr:hypothetical protein E2562_038752 [Oryza meyeriana var. granulata]
MASCGSHAGIVGGSVVTIIASAVAGAGEEASWSWSGASDDVDVIVGSMHACTPLCVETWHNCSCAATVFAEIVKGKEVELIDRTKSSNSTAPFDC